MPTEGELREALIRHISGYEPQVTGGLCDGCPAAFQEGDDVVVDASFDGSTWSLARTFCEDHDLDVSDLGTNALVECELGPPVGGEWFPLYNPEVLEIHVAEAHGPDVATDGGVRCPSCGDPHGGESALCSGCSPAW